MRSLLTLSQLLAACAPLLVSLPAAAQSWVTSSFSISRHLHGAATLPGGDVLVVGGYIDQSTWTARTVERYDASTGTWSTFGESPGDHYTFVHVLPLPDGRLLVASMEAPFDTYDPASDTWTTLGDASVFDSDMAVTQLADGDVFFVGGGMDFDDWGSAYRFDADTDTLDTVASLPVPRRSLAATLLADGRVLVTGGLRFVDEIENFEALTSAEIYDPVADRWTVAAPIPQARYDHRAALLPDGRVLVTGGVGTGYEHLPSTVIYDPATDAWTSGPTMAAGRALHTATTLPSGRVVMVGGAGAGRAVELYDPATSAFVALPSLSHDRQSHTTTYIPGKGLLAISGSTAELYALGATAEGEACVIAEECADGTCEDGRCTDDGGGTGAGPGDPGGPPGGGCSPPWFDLGAMPGHAAMLLVAPGMFAWRRRRSGSTARPRARHADAG
ncbi:hypothetical protein WMF38_43895 [Sorangium sp. So ce118]